MVFLPYDKYQRLQQKTGANSGDAPPISKGDVNIPLNAVPRHLKNRAEILLNYIKENTSIIWNEKGEIIIDDKLIPFSNITDLVKDAIFQYKDFSPVGKIDFYNQLHGIPLTLIHNLNRRKLIQEGRGDISGPPPPGIPDNDKAVRLTQEKLDKDKAVRLTQRIPDIAPLHKKKPTPKWHKFWQAL